nr:AbrB/MazE/SpoVT family DNA-binding domain-containing protein [Alicyclobacillus tolerans]
MKSTGIVRQVDHLGHIVLPKSIRDQNGIDYQTPIEIFVDGDRIILEI